MSSPAAQPPMKRRQQVVATYKMAKKSDRFLGLWILGAFVLGAAVGYGLFWLMPGSGWLGTVLSVVGALLFGMMTAAIVFGRRAQASAYRQMDGKLGSAASALSMLRRGWKVDEVVGFTRQQDVVHRVVGPPGIVLVGEGSSHSRVKQLLVTERRKHERVASEIPIHEVICGRGDGEVPLPQLIKHVRKLGKNLRPADMTDLLYRLKALDAHRSNMPIPKGPVPTSMKGQRGNMRGR
jgi:hypothetical protein